MGVGVGGRAAGRSHSVSPESGAQRLIVPSRTHPKDVCSVGGDVVGEGRQGTATHHICQVHHRFGKVAGEDYRLSHLLKLGEGRVGRG